MSGFGAGDWPSVTVAILTFNGERYLEAILSALEGQLYDGSLEILVVDSGSTDGTLDIVRAHDAVRLHEIPNAEFGHGRTRNLAVRLAESDVVVLLTHDAVPVGDDFVSQLVAPFANPRVAVSLARQVARPSAPPALKYIIERVFRAQGDGVGVSLHDRESAVSTGRDVAAFVSDVAVGLRRSVVLGEVSYRDVAYAEDQLLGRDILDAGFVKAYVPGAVVEHSNDGALREFGERALADRRGLNAVGIPPVNASWWAPWARLVKWSAVDAALILRDRELSVPRRMYWLGVNPAYHWVRVWNDHRGAREFRGSAESAQRGERESHEA